tara:strand:+ start:6250 stop:6837 length:588 start_codon:yes stop_codon:yes gene_type:complete
VNRNILALAAVFIFSAGPALAHTGAGPVSGLWYGFLHPFAGLDHVLAMVAVGILAVQQGGRATWLLPVTFVTVMLAGSAVAMAGIPLILVEQGILGSVIVLGGVIALGRQIHWPVAAGFVGLFAVFHGHAHGAEITVGIGGLEYMAGFAVATAVLHLTGLALGGGTSRLNARLSRTLIRSGGAAIASAGVLLAAF